MNAIPLIVQAAKASNIHLATLLYMQANISVLPVKADKSPALKYWQHLQTRIAQHATINHWQRCELLTGVGLILGKVSGNLVVIDCDGLDAVDAFTQRFPKLVDTYTVVSGSRQGAHFYYYAKWCPPTTRVTGLSHGNIELRSNGTYVVAPPSIHSSGNAYTVSNPTRIQHVFDMNEVVNWIKDLMREKHGGVLPPARNAASNEVRHSDAYGRAALAGECASVRMAPAGNRNDQLYRSALKLGSLIADNRIDRGTVESDLFAAAAALAESDGPESARRTIASGIDKGLESSRERHTKYA
jgi:hypothetical protein